MALIDTRQGLGNYGVNNTHYSNYNELIGKSKQRNISMLSKFMNKSNEISIVYFFKRHWITWTYLETKIIKMRPKSYHTIYRAKKVPGI